MKKLLLFAVALGLACALSGCDKQKIEVIPSSLPSQTAMPTPTPTPPRPTPPTVDVALTYDPEELEPWQTAYIQLLEGEFGHNRTDGVDVLAYRYYLYDIDKNNIPELFLIDTRIEDGMVYTYQQDEIEALTEWTEVGAFHMDRSELYSWPEGNGVLRYRTTHSVCTMALYSVDGGHFSIEFLDTEDKTERNSDGFITKCPVVQDYYPDSYPLISYPVLTEAPERRINVLPIVNCVPPREQIKQENIFPREFWHMTGVGGWSTELRIEKDGSFEGNDNWHRILEGGEEWEMYSCNFSGKFCELKKVNEYTYSVQLEKLDIGPGWQGMENDADWSKVEGSASGIEGGEEFLIYLPGAPVEELPEEFLLWTMLMVWKEDTVLPGYGLYNVNEQIGWFDRMG